MENSRISKKKEIDRQSRMHSSWKMRALRTRGSTFQATLRKSFLWRVSSRFFKILSAHTIQRTPGLGAALALWNRTWLAGKKNVVSVMRRLIKSSGPRASSRATYVRTHAFTHALTHARTYTHVRVYTHTPILNPRARINTHLHKARLVYTWSLGRAETVSQRSSSASYHAALLRYSFSFPPLVSLSFTSRSMLHLAFRIFIFVSARRDTIRTADRGAETVRSFIGSTAM